MSLQAAKEIIFNYRTYLASILILFSVYLIWYSNFSTPNFSTELRWVKDQGLIVKPYANDKYDQLTPFSQVLSVDGIAAQRGRPLFPYRSQPSYEIELLNEDSVKETVLVEDKDASPFRALDSVYQIIVTLLFLLSGFGAVLFAAKAKQPDIATLVGFTFQLLGILAIGGAVVTFGGVGAWLVNAIWFVAPTIPIVLVLVLIEDINKLVVRSLVVMVSALFVASLIEYKLLFPTSDWSEVIGISSTNIIDFLFLSGLILALLTALRMSIKAESQLARYDSRLLLTTLTIVLIPVGATVFIDVLADEAAKFVSTDPIIFTYLLLIPLFYTYILFRHSFRIVSKTFARILAVFLLGTVIIAIIYTFGFLMAVSNIVSSPNMQYASMGVAVIVGFALLPVTSSIASVLVHGSHRSIEEVASASFYQLGSDPTKENMGYVLSDISTLFGCSKAAISVHFRNANKMLLIEDDKVEPIPCQHDKWTKADWVFQDIPLAASGDLSMNLLLSHPLHGSFSLRQQYDLKALAATLGASVQLVLHHLNQQERLEQAMLDKEMWRRQLSTELHNGPVQNMTLLVKKLNRQLDTDSLHQVQDMAKEITSELRSLCSRLQPFSSNTMPAWIIREQVRSFQEENPGIAVSLTIDTEPAPRPPDVVCLALRFILEESLANIAKHAQADMVQVKATHDLQKLELEVTDNGSGADHLYQTPHDHSNGQGLMDMKYWASLAKGAFSVISLTGERGVKVSVLFKAENYIYLPELQLLPAADATNKYAYSST